MYGKPFNTKRPYGEVHGIAAWTYEQDGQLYNAQKQPVDESGNLMPLAPDAPAARAEIPTTAAAQRMELDEDDTPADEKPLDLRAWALGDKELSATPWQTVRSAAADTLGDISELKSKEALRKALLEHFNEA